MRGSIRARAGRPVDARDYSGVRWCVDGGIGASAAVMTYDPTVCGRCARGRTAAPGGGGGTPAPWDVGGWHTLCDDPEKVEEIPLDLPEESQQLGDGGIAVGGGIGCGVRRDGSHVNPELYQVADHVLNRR